MKAFRIFVGILAVAAIFGSCAPQGDAYIFTSFREPSVQGMQ